MVAIIIDIHYGNLFAYYVKHNHNTEQFDCKLFLVDLVDTKCVYESKTPKARKLFEEAIKLTYNRMIIKIEIEEALSIASMNDKMDYKIIRWNEYFPGHNNE